LISLDSPLATHYLKEKYHDYSITSHSSNPRFLRFYGAQSKLGKTLLDLGNGLDGVLNRQQSER
jgi:hypothetical protein